MRPAHSVLLLAACASAGPERVDVRGSDSEVNLVQALGEAYGNAHPDVAIAVTGGGSGVGIAALIDGTADLATSSRAMKPGEHLLALRKGVEPVATLFATDALIVIVHADNPVASLTLDQVGQLFGEQPPEWTDVGGPRADVIAYGRQSSSGTYSFFRDQVVKGDYGGRVREMNGNAQIVEAVAADLGGVGYVAVGYLQKGASGIRPVPIAPSPHTLPVDPLDEAAVLAGRYPIARPLYQYTRGTPAGPVADFLRYELSTEGEATVRAMGFYPLVHAWRDRNAHLGVR